MISNAKVSILASLSKNIFITRKKDIVQEYLDGAKKIKRTSKLKFSNNQLRKYCEFVGWERDEIPPTFPYALITHIQLSMVTDRKFPFSAFGIFHKQEKIECYFPLRKGEWEMTCCIPKFTKVDKGYEIEIISTLKIDGELAWKSTTTAFKKTKRGFSRYKYESIETEGLKRWNLTANHGLKYAFLSNNFDLIHISLMTARLMGLKRPIMHGMWTAARGISEVKNIQYPLNVDYRFVAPIYIPDKVVYQETQEGFKVYSENGKRLHVDTQIS